MIVNPIKMCNGLLPRLMLVVFLLGASMPGRSGEIIRGRVVGVHDGDTITLLTESKQLLSIRLAQIDAPESDQAFGQVSKQSLAGLVFNQSVGIAVETVDAHDRIVGTVSINGLDVCREQIKRGMAWAYRQYLRDTSLLALEEQARRAKVGLWSDAHPTPPWAYRHGGRSFTTPYPSSPTSSTHSAACGDKRHCKDMASCEEAKYYLTQCGLLALDRDKDGIPCESLCRTNQ